MRSGFTLLAVTASALVASPLAAQSGSAGPARYGEPIPFAAAPSAGPAPAAPYNAAPASNMVWQGGRWVAMPRHAPQTVQPTGNRWGATINGRWAAGYRAPGGWGGYRRIGRGQMLPSYWLLDDFLIGDYLAWGIDAPPYGYRWVRYYDDAVLVDAQGRAWDSVGGIAWAGAAASSDDDGSQSYSRSTSSVGAGYPPPGAEYAPFPPPPPGGAAQGYAGGGNAPPVVYAPPAAHMSSGYAENGWSGGYAYGGGAASVTVVTLPAAPVITTTTTVTEEVIERPEVVSYATVRRVYRPRRRVVHHVACCPCRCG